MPIVSAVLTIVAIIATPVTFFAVMDWVRRKGLSYRFDDDELCIVVRGPLHPRPIPYWNIAEVEIVSLLDFVLDSRFGSLREGSWTTKGLPWKYVVLWLRDGRDILLSPDDASAFARELRERVDKAVALRQPMGAAESLPSHQDSLRASDRSGGSMRGRD